LSPVLSISTFDFFALGLDFGAGVLYSFFSDSFGLDFPLYLGFSSLVSSFVSVVFYSFGLDFDFDFCFDFCCDFTAFFYSSSVATDFAFDSLGT
jgi:hypothetical protein